MAIIVAQSNSKIREIDWLYLCLQQFDEFSIWSRCDYRKRKNSCNNCGPQSSREVDWLYLCLQQFDKFSIWSRCDYRKRKKVVAIIVAQSNRNYILLSRRSTRALWKWNECFCKCSAAAAVKDEMFVVAIKNNTYFAKSLKLATVFPLIKPCLE